MLTATSKYKRNARIALLATLLARPLPLPATINPQIYQDEQRRAPEKIEIRIESVVPANLQPGEDGVALRCIARVLSVTRTNTGLAAGKTISLKLVLPTAPIVASRAGCGAPPALRRPVAGETYEAYLEFRGSVYVPAAGWLSLTGGR